MTRTSRCDVTNSTQRRLGGILAKTQHKTTLNLDLNTRKQSDKPRMRTSLQDNWPEVFKNVNLCQISQKRMELSKIQIKRA